MANSTITAVYMRSFIIVGLIRRDIDIRQRGGSDVAHASDDCCDGVHLVWSGLVWAGLVIGVVGDDVTQKCPSVHTRSRYMTGGRIGCAGLELQIGWHLMSRSRQSFQRLVSLCSQSLRSLLNDQISQQQRPQQWMM